VNDMFRFISIFKLKLLELDLENISEICKLILFFKSIL